MTKSRRDGIAGLIFLAGALVLYSYADGMPVRENQNIAISPGFYPMLLSILLGILSLMQIVGAVLQGKRSQNQEKANPIWKDSQARNLLVVTFGTVVTFPFLLRAFGFVISSFLFLAILIAVLSLKELKEGKWKILALVTLGIGLVTYLVFQVFLGIPFPTGIFSPY